MPSDDGHDSPTAPADPSFCDDVTAVWREYSARPVARLLLLMVIAVVTLFAANHVVLARRRSAHAALGSELHHHTHSAHPRSVVEDEHDRIRHLVEGRDTDAPASKASHRAADGDMGSRPIERTVPDPKPREREAEAEQATPRPRFQWLDDELSALRHRLERLKAQEPLEEYRTAVSELEQRRKTREALQTEYAWADEQEEHRERQRQRDRLRWRAEERRFRRWAETVADGGDHDDDQPGETPAALAVAPGGDEVPSTRRGRCAKAPRPFVRFGEAALKQEEFAYVTFVSNAEYVVPAAVLMHSIAMSGSQYSRAVCVTPEVSARDRSTLALFGQVIEIEKIPSPLYVDNPRYRDVFTKLRIWELTMFTKILYIDTDVIVTRNMDDLFDLNEWSIPMDAEQARYSTGMMICEPSQATFDDMMKKLNTTSVSMELPDLLFLKEYFDERPPAPAPTAYGWAPPSPPQRVNIIPRWYQVYQEEFGSEYHTYLTARKQKITIFDERIHGIHYPGAGKPWLGNMATKLAKFRPGFCHWHYVEEFKYQPQFLWYLHYTWMKQSLLNQGTSQSIFDAEFGAGVVVLRDFVAKKRKEKEEAAAGGNGYAPYGGYSPYGGGSPDAPAAQETPAPAPTPDPDRLWNATPCVVRHAGPLVVSRQDPGTGRRTLALTATAPVPAVTPDTVPVVDLTGLPPVVLQLPQRWAGKELEPYTWTVTWCTPSSLRPDQTTACGARSFVAQYSDGQCRTNFAEGLTAHLLLGSGDGPRDVLGVVLRSHVDLDGPPRRKYVEVVVRCAWELPEGVARIEAGVQSVPVDTVAPEPNRRYTVRLQSRCACAGGCGLAKATAAARRGADDGEVEAWVKEQAGVDLPAVFAPGTLFAACFGAAVAECLATPACDYDVGGKRCRPSVEKWISVAKADAGLVVNCSHVGGDGEKVVSLGECQDAASKAGANAVNYRAWTTGEGAAAGGCYYKRCDAAVLFRGEKVTMPTDGAGFGVTVRNPFYVSDTDAAAFEVARKSG